MKYKNTLQEIINLPWENLSSTNLEKLMIISYFNAIEFAESLRIALRMYPKNYNLKLMAIGELKTDNLQFDDFKKKGDHSEFLEYFIKKFDLIKKYPNVMDLGDKYLKEIRNLSDKTRAMSVISRENELHKIFQKVKINSNFSSKVLESYYYFLDMHITLDTEEGGHSDLVSEIEIDDSIDEFYVIRLKIYNELPVK
jgi:hypothetical protein